MTEADVLANAERPPGLCPALSPEHGPAPHEGYWPGSATGHVEYWQRRALAAERELAELRAVLRLDFA